VCVKAVEGVVIPPGESALAWWLPKILPCGGWEYRGVGQSLDAVYDAGSFDGVLGFSQGAAMASLVASIAVDQHAADLTPRKKSPRKKSPRHPLTAPLLLSTGPRFAVFCGGFVFDPKAPTHFFRRTHSTSSNIIQLPSLHVIGEADKIVKPHTSAKLEALFEPSTRTTHRHQGGHVFHSSETATKVYRQFFQEQHQHGG
jgi:predicted esterase